MRFHLLFVLLFAVPFAPAQADEAPLDTVEYVDLERYLGTWYEVARIDHGFQEGCYNSTAEYSRRDDGDIRVINSCDIEGKKKRKQAKGRAWVVEEETNAKLKVQFPLSGIKLSFLAGNYWVLDLGPNYSHALIGEPSREYLWILSRSPEMPEDALNAVLSKAVALGYDKNKILLNRNLRPEGQ